MKKSKFKYRMYGFVPYNISEIQKGIQFGHAVCEYVKDELLSPSQEFKDWIHNDKTFIILNGGTTNESFETKWYGTLNALSDEIFDAKIKHANFYEPDLGDQLTAVVFLADERVWDYEKYPSFKSYVELRLLNQIDEIDKSSKDYETGSYYSKLTSELLSAKGLNDEDLKDKYRKFYPEWLETIGGLKNEFLRNLIKNKNLA